MGIVRLGNNAWREAFADDSGVIVDAADYYRALYWTARQARCSILMSGWQFDSGVELLRGNDKRAGEETRLLKFLNGLCEANADLQIFLLAWDFHVVLAAERQWLQGLLFDWTTNPRFHFRFDDCPVSGGSQHQKFVVVDGKVAYLGGMDVCEARWDDRRHLSDQPLRTERGTPSKPYHDVQAYVAGTRAAKVLEDLFVERWKRSGGEAPQLRAPEVADAPKPPRGLLRFGPSQVAFSRTEPCADEKQTVREVERLFLDAIGAAESLIYIETQYFSSRVVCEALVLRMREEGRPRLQVVIVVNERAEAVKEELAVGLRQAENLEHLRRVAADTAHELGIYGSSSDGPSETFHSTYIHSKVLLIDDRFLTVGSANMTNRSMGTDSEIHVSWESKSTTTREDRRRTRAIRRVRVSLLAEHGGLSRLAVVRGLARVDGLVSRLAELAALPGARLQPHGPPSSAQAAAMLLLDPKNLPFDPDTSPRGDDVVDEPADEATEGWLSGLSEALGSLRGLLRS